MTEMKSAVTLGLSNSGLFSKCLPEKIKTNLKRWGYLSDPVVYNI